MNSYIFTIPFVGIESLSKFLIYNFDKLHEKFTHPKFDFFGVEKRDIYYMRLKYIKLINYHREVQQIDKDVAICFLIDAYLYNTKKIFLDDSNQGKEGNKIILQFEEKKHLIINDYFNSEDEKIVYIKKIDYNPLHRKYIIKSSLGLDLNLYDSIDHFKKEFLNLSKQPDFNQYMMGIINGFQTYNLSRRNLNFYQFPQERKYSYNFLYYLTEAFLSPELTEIKEKYGIYVIRWLKARLKFAMSAKDIEESLEKYFYLLIDKKDKWIWRYIDPENEMKDILDDKNLKRIIFSKKASRNSLLDWMKTRYSSELNSIVFK